MDIESRRKRVNRVFGNITFAIVLIAGLYIFATGSETLPEKTRYLILAAVALYAAVRLGSRFLRHKNHGAKR
ncbi:MAG: hypothetical protein IIB00_09475 [candidate division Zixibacteria bacterium]|nr:hypothetical protein [candidate division Zixibacteria bacterium]